MEPEFHAPSLAVDVWAVVSLFVQAIVLPTGTTIGLGAKAVLVRVLAPLTIDTVSPGDGDGDGEGDGDGDGEGDGDGVDGVSYDDPQPSERASKSVVSVSRMADMYEFSFQVPSQTSDRHAQSLFIGGSGNAHAASYDACLYWFRLA
jgi:hypothetical protein